MNEKGRISSAQARELLQRQLTVWHLARENYKAYANIQSRRFDMGGFTIEAQYNPSRMPSSSAKIDEQSLRQRPCFLCPHHLPQEQEKLPFGTEYFLLCNPYPIFPEHFTISSREHAAQEILPRFADFLDLSRQLEACTVFYNGPKSGASAPDHLHFQAVTRRRMPVERELNEQLSRSRLVLETSGGRLYALTDYLHNCFVIKARTRETATALFRTVYNALDIEPDETEPKMNLFALCDRQEGQTLILVPRRRHRPWQCAAEGADKFLSSPGAADMGGLFITVRKEDFERLTSDILRDIYGQVCYSDADMGRAVKRIKYMNPKH
ncbi:ATP adenylyltransferase (5',5'''-P-1,P-4-tetraphosphate phosphorylase II) [Bacteroidales bacterium Barb6]|nr:ATP adenylyltransferase (5',5'''-P-1,P-4-tetraphosphate phosphorylase II) [Bacteroidales bacterium Barb6]